MGTATIKAEELRRMRGEERSAEWRARAAQRGLELSDAVLDDVERARCEGYTNYATSSVALTLENDRTMSARLAQLVEVAVKAAPGSQEVRDGTWTVGEATRFKLADYLKDYVERLMERGIKDGDAGLVASALVRAGFSEVDWQDLARVELARADES